MAATIADHLSNAERDLEQVATALGKAGAPDQLTGTFTKMAEVCRRAAPELRKLEPDAAPKPDMSSPQDQQTKELAGDPNAAANAPDQGPVQSDRSAPPNSKPSPMQAASTDLHAEVRKRAAARRAGGAAPSRY